MEFAKENKYEAVSGTKKEVRISFEEAPKFPRKGTRERELLEKWLKESGVWEKAVDLSGDGIERILKNSAVPEELKKELKKLTPIEQKWSVSRLFNRKDISIDESENE